MKKIAVLISALIIASVSLAKPVPTPDQRSGTNEKAIKSTSELFRTDANGDMIMPSFEELLGEPIDNLGRTGGNEALKDELVSFAKNYLGIRYRRGGKTPKGFDCSGFTSYVFRQFGMKLNASSSSQYTQGEAVEDMDLLPGDLVFFSGRAVSKTRVGHVGLVTDVNPDGTFKFIHSSNSQGVTVSKSTEPYYSRRYIGARRVR